MKLLYWYHHFIKKLLGTLSISLIAAESKVTKEKDDFKIPVQQIAKNSTIPKEPVVSVTVKVTSTATTTHAPTVTTTSTTPRIGIIGRIRKFFSRSYDDGVSLSCVERAASDGSMVNQYYVEDHKGKRIIEPTDQIYVYTKKYDLWNLEILFWNLN